MSEPVVDEADVKHAATLARMELTDEEIAQFQSEFAAIFSYFDRLDEVPDIEPDHDLVNVLRSDEVRDSLSQEDALANAHDVEDGYFKGPRVS